jgi:tetratricopeptide (TPR) repeat protein
MRSFIFLLIASTLYAQSAPEPPQALILSAESATILRAGSELPLTARPGQILFSGDSLRGAATFLSCTAKSEQTLSADADLLLDPKAPKLRSGKISATKPADGCFLPPLPRTIVASQQHAGAAIARENAREVVAQTFQQRLQQLPEAPRVQLTTELAPLDAAIAANPKDNVKRLARAAALDRAGLDFDAADEMSRVTKDWPDAAEVRSRLFVLEEKAGKNAAAAGSKPAEAETEGNTYALLVGISAFQDKTIKPLEFAHADAIELSNLIRSPRAGAIPADNVVTLPNEKATQAAIRSAIETHLKARAGANDTIFLFIASHGAMVDKKGYIVAYDSNPQELATSGIPMDDIRELFETQLSKVKRLYLYVDVCHAGNVGQIDTKADDKVTERALVAKDLQMFGMLAAQKNQVAFEGVNYGGGHGAFSFFLMEALNGLADFNSDGRVTMSELSDYVQDKVKAATVRRQIPKQIGDIDETRIMALTGKPGIELKAYTPETLTAGRSLTPVIPRTAAGGPTVVTSSTLRYQAVADTVKQYDTAIGQGRILPAEDQSAFTFLDTLQQRLKPEDYRPQAEKLRVTLEDQGQQVLLKYLAGEAAPQTKADFVRGQTFFEAALPLAPDSLFLQSRAIFCQGRAAMFDKNYAAATALIERAIGLDPTRAYGYNALGIIALERAEYDRAIPAFREASKRAPYWAYPMHNLALAYVEKGDYDAAIRTYQRAKQLAPGVLYLPYNLGLLYQRLNRPRDAEAEYRKALVLDARNAQTLNALGALKAESGRRAEAEQLYKQALTADPGLLAARYNLAQLLAADSKRASEAVPLWRDNLTRDPQHLPSRIALAGSLAAAGNTADAAREYDNIVAARPDYVAARIALADARPADAIPQLEAALKLQPENPEILERLGRAYTAAGRKSDADASFRKALALSTDSAAKKRIRAALK